MSLSKNKVKRRCRFVKIKNGFSMSQNVAFFCQVLSTVGILEVEQDCRYIFGIFEAMSLVEGLTKIFCISKFTKFFNAAS